MRAKIKKTNPAKTLVLGYLMYSIIGFLLLSLPICHKAHVAFIDDFFISTSAISTTGLATVDIGSKYNFFGQLVILLLIQIGGVGYMTFSSFLVLCTSEKLSLHRRKIGASSFSLPNDFCLKEFIRHLVVYTCICESIGAIFLSLLFWHQGVEEFVWNGIFHSISAFCTAGFSLFSAGIAPFRDDVGINLVISLLSIVGGSLGFIVSLDFYKNWTSPKKGLSFTSRVILIMIAIFLAIGTIVFFLLELKHSRLDGFQKWMIGFFQVTSASTTTGFNTVDIGSLTPAMLLLLAFLSTFGASPSGTGGGLKNTTFASLLVFVKNILKGKPIALFNHLIPMKRVKLATVAFIVYVFALSIFLFFLNLTETKQQLLPIFFEAANAINNSGLSMGLTSNLTAWGKILICFLMFIGRTGVITFSLALSFQTDEDEIAPTKQAELAL